MKSSWTKLTKGKYDWYYHNKEANLELLQKFIDENNFVSASKSRATTTIKWFLEHGKDVGKYTLDDELPYPYGDHDYYFKYASGECVYVSQPYCTKAEAESKVKEWAEKHGIQAVVYDKEYSWYYPHHSCLIVASLPDREVKVFKN